MSSTKADIEGIHKKREQYYSRLARWWNRKPQIFLRPTEILTQKQYTDQYILCEKSGKQLWSSCYPDCTKPATVKPTGKSVALSWHSLSPWHSITRLGGNYQLLASSRGGEETTAPYVQHSDFHGRIRGAFLRSGCYLTCLRAQMGLQMPGGCWELKRAEQCAADSEDPGYSRQTPQGTGIMNSWNKQPANSSN